MSHRLQCGNHRLSLTHPQVMGVVNVTPDSFYDGGRYCALESAVAQANALVNEGASIIDIGGESTRPGAHSPSEQEEIDRVLPVIEALVKTVPVPISIDSSRPRVLQAAIEAGVSFINDVRALTVPGALEVVAASNLPVCLMHMRGTPTDMQKRPQYSSVVTDVLTYLQERVDACVEAGIDRSRLLIDPGFGFGKTVAHNLQLLRELSTFKTLGLPILVGLSRKSLIGQVAGVELIDRLPGSLALAVMAAINGAQVLRAHDVAATVQAMKLVHAVTDERAAEEQQYNLQPSGQMALNPV